jgi:hypothetical protein
MMAGMFWRLRNEELAPVDQKPTTNRRRIEVK